MKTVNGVKYVEKDGKWLNVSTGQLISELPKEKWRKFKKTDVKDAIRTTIANFEMDGAVYQVEFIFTPDKIIREKNDEFVTHEGLDRTYFTYIKNSDVDMVKELGFEPLGEDVYQKDDLIVDMGQVVNVTHIKSEARKSLSDLMEN